LVLPSPVNGANGDICVTMALSQYDQVVLDASKIPTRWKIIITIFSWLLLTGFVLLPRAFITVQRTHILPPEVYLQRVPVLAIAIILYFGSLVAIICTVYLIPSNDV
jgi:hypothetical protein